ncbi:transglycosylase SLT domain-containing protein [Thiomicrorhabdus aquaedulcis]|uniref:transglycosylase SLT domain-containing protein n=1 Tax=Thiomicrorhabdus aquaedulcis TaxID=2211106 RepID=UPI001562362D|nr:transglycosylase SLT domain-containing protein [Thiomicrorhabdus aquaedulcis]
MFVRIIGFLVLLGLGINSSAAQVNPDTLTQPQKDFLDAYEAIKKNDRTSVASYKAKLKNYVLYPYILFHDYSFNFKNTPPALIESFIKDNGHNHLGEQLNRRWLAHLANTKQWNAFLKAYTPQKSQDLQCFNIQALAASRQSTVAIPLAQSIWQESTTLSNACKPLDTLLTTQKQLTPKMVWSRIELAINKKQFTQAKAFAQYLSAQETKMLDYWLLVHKDPKLIVNNLPKTFSPAVKKLIFSYGITQLASSEPILAKQSLDKFHKTYALNTEQYQTLERKIALRTAYRYKPEAKALLNDVNTQGSKTEETTRWQAQIAIKNSDWPGLLDIIELMDKSEREDSQWIYWKARALDATNQAILAKPLFESLAKQRNFYAFLAADKLNLKYQFNPKPIQPFDKPKLIQKYPELLRIQELLAIDWPLSARREWNSLLSKADNNELQAVAVLADQWQLHAQAIQTLAKANYWDALDLRFPTPHKEPVMQNAAKNNLDPAWVYGIIRRESAFSADIESPTGALGLMQIMPKTAAYIGKKTGNPKYLQNHLTQADNNIELGSAYLSSLYKKYNGNRVLATAAYNAGPSRVDSWVANHQNLPADQWIDSIPFSETRAYVKAVLEYTTIFKSIMNQQYDRLNDVMPNIGIQAIQSTDPAHP